MSDLFLGVTWADIADWLPELLRGLKTSLLVAAISLAVGLPLGVALAVARSNSPRAIRWPAIVVIELGRGIPALVILKFVYFGLPQSGIALSSLPAAIVTLAWATGAYTSDMFRAGIEAVGKGQGEAASVLGIGPWDSFRFIIFPQAIYIALPSVLGFSILLFEATSLCFTISVSELMSKAYEIGSMTFHYFPALGLAGLMYAMICIPASLLTARLERRIASDQ
jgi:polar amino acid transport system permease protein